MTYLFIFLGIALLGAGAALFVLDSRRRARASSSLDDAHVAPGTAPETEEARGSDVADLGESESEAAREPAVEPGPEPEPEDDREPVIDVDAEPELDHGPGPVPAPEPRPDPELSREAHTVVEAESAEKTESADVAASAAPTDPIDPADEPLDLEPEPAPVRRHRPSLASRFPTREDLRNVGPLAGMAARRARRAWALGRNADFRKIDAEVASWWDRVPAGDARDVVSGFAHGREMHLCDVGGVTLLALRRAIPSDEILEFSRDGRTDLPEVGVEDGITVSATDPEIIHRIFDERAHRALRDLPDVIDAAWAEGEWVIGAFADGSGPDDWDDALAPLAAFADIARRLPPSPGSIGELDAGHRDPTRPAAGDGEVAAPGHLRPLASGSPVATAPAAATAVAEPADEAPTWRPPTAPPVPVDMPTRSVGKRMGDGEFRDIGESASGLPALGEDPEHSRATVTGGRIIRPDTGPAGIFGDGAPEPDITEASDSTDTDTDEDKDQQQ
ncbi:hypothetical protein [Corynebacterium xerosis]|uniref:Uncharacterized protein n=1 Tax=Corynebacterium xerosis TaxID=1725 RepID=A0A7X9SYA3_9CORY|nr:hypothetical protein [Corynebacterium xerosis]NMF10047.1 hypothetical protein [Corynebacterium xerosis]